MNSKLQINDPYEQICSYLNHIAPQTANQTLPLRAIRKETNELQGALVNLTNIDEVSLKILDLNQLGFQIYSGIGYCDSEKHPPSTFQTRPKYPGATDIKYRSLFALDIDFPRPKVNGLKRSATVEQESATLQAARWIQHQLHKEDVQTGIGYSGNGHYILAKLPYEAPRWGERSLKLVTKGIGGIFADSTISIDQSVSSNGSLIRLFGTINHCYDADGRKIAKRSSLMEPIPTWAEYPHSLIEQCKQSIEPNPKPTLRGSAKSQPNSSKQPSNNSNEQYDLTTFLQLVQDNINLDLVYGPYLTGYTTSRNDLYCKDPFVPHSSNPICAVSQGDTYQRGRFYSFTTRESLSILEFYSRLHSLNYVEAAKQVSAISGIQIPLESK